MFKTYARNQNLTHRSNTILIREINVEVVYFLLKKLKMALRVSFRQQMKY